MTSAGRPYHHCTRLLSLTERVMRSRPKGDVGPNARCQLRLEATRRTIIPHAHPADGATRELRERAPQGRTCRAVRGQPDQFWESTASASAAFRPMVADGIGHGPQPYAIYPAVRALIVSDCGPVHGCRSRKHVCYEPAAKDDVFRAHPCVALISVKPPRVFSGALNACNPRRLERHRP